MRRAAIIGTGAFLPEKVLTNADLEALVDTNNEWIVERTGICERRVVADEDSTSDLAVRAGRTALEDAGLTPNDIDLVIVCTATPDRLIPPTAMTVQSQLGAERAGSFDLQSACAGFIYGLSAAGGMIASGMHRRVLLVGAETLTRFVDYTDRRTCILFGDAAAAVVLEGRDDGSGLLYSRLYSDGRMADMICIPAGGSSRPPTVETLAGREHYIQVEGRKVFRFATGAFVELVREALEKCQMTPDDLALVIPHQMNARIIEAAMKRVDVPREKCYMNIDRYGNTSSASIPLALDEARREGRVGPGDKVLLMGFGAGLTWGATVVKM